MIRRACRCPTRGGSLAGFRVSGPARFNRERGGTRGTTFLTRHVPCSRLLTGQASCQTLSVITNNTTWLATGFLLSDR